ncbi:MAG: hypothetical protein HOV80_30645, partial [Polyangiaceae bacterium]|nr:hypothetical protein [Polyangiaceae bacterium]
MRDPHRSAPALEQVAAWQHAVGHAHAESSALRDPFAHRELSRRLTDISTLLAEVEDADDVDAALLESVERTLALVAGARQSIAGDAFASGAGRRARDVLVLLERAITSARLPTADAAATHGRGRTERLRYGVTASAALPVIGDPDRATLFSPHEVPTSEETELDPAHAWRQFPSGAAVPSRSGTRAFSPEAAARADIARKMTSAFEEIGSLGSIRKPALDEPWSPEARLDRRLLAYFDAALTLARPIKLFVVSKEGGSHPARVHVDIGAALLQW